LGKAAAASSTIESTNIFAVTRLRGSGVSSLPTYVEPSTFRIWQNAGPVGQQSIFSTDI